MKHFSPPDSLTGGLLAALDEHAIVSVTDAGGSIVYVNHRFCKISGYSSEELIGKNHRLLQSGAHDASFYKDMWQRIHRGQTWRGEICNRSKSGELYWVDATITPELDSTGRPSRYVSIRTDISATKRAQHRAEVAEERYRRSQTFGNVSTWDLDLQTLELVSTESILSLPGDQPGAQSLPFKSFMDGVHEEDRAAVLAAIINSVETGTPYEIEHRYVRPDGSVRWLLERGDITRGPSGQPLHMLGVMQDVTARREAQAQLALFRHAVESTSEGIFLCDLETGRIDYHNPAARSILGWPSEAAIGIDPLTLVPEHVRAEFSQVIENTKKGNATQFDFTFMRPDGVEIPLRNSLTPMRDETGTVRHFLNIFGDRSVEIERQLELQAALGKARRADRAKAEFMSHMSHELRTPLNAILGFSQVLLLRKDLDSDQTESVNEVLNAGNHLLELVDEVLDIARIEMGTLRVSMEPVRLGEVVGQAIALITSDAQDREISVSHDIGAEIAVSADHLRLKQCLINLLSNAIKYNRSGGFVRVRCCEQVSGYIRIEVEDSGPGISAEEREQLFQPFARLARHSDTADGIGIGLSITQQLVKLMNGEVGVSGNQTGVGSIFWIDLKQADLNGNMHAIPSVFGGLELPAPARKVFLKQVLYVEDNPANLKLVCSMLRLLPNVGVLTATTVAEGMTIAGEHHPDLLLLDIGLPGPSGYELLAWLRRDPELADTPVIAISANALPADVERGLRAGFDEYLTKPVDVHKLLNRVQAALALSGGEP